MRLAVSFLVCVALLALTGAALANQPDPNQSTFEQCLGRSPKNNTADPSAQYTFTGVLRDNTGAPVPNYPAAQVTLDILAPCQNPVTLNPDGPSDPTGLVVWGVATLNQGGGACEGAGVVDIKVGGVTFETLNDVRSPDEDGDTFVALADLSAWQQSFVNQTPIFQGDLDCDTFIALTDLSWWQKHFVAP